MVKSGFRGERIIKWAGGLWLNQTSAERLAVMVVAMGEEL